MLEYMEYVYAVYQEQSFSKAARKLYVSQPWLSTAVKKVEQMLKFPIFDRSTTPISLTEEGRFYIEHIERILEIEKEMTDYYALRKNDSEITIRIGSSMSLCVYVLPRLLEEFRDQYPGVTLQFLEGNRRSHYEKLIRGQLDLFIDAEQLEHPSLETVPWAAEEILLGVPADNPINRELGEYCYTFEEMRRRNEPKFQKPAVPLIRFRDEPFLILTAGNDSNWRNKKLCENAGFSPRISIQLSHMMSAYYLVCESQGVSFLRSSITDFVQPGSDRIVFYRLDDPLAFRSLYLSYPKAALQNPVKQALISELQDRSLKEAMEPSV